ncbi:MAG: thioesterase family protein [Proteobacteria bacterium]|nr:thioesterase family protein [Pseudomonadota bacterium]
MHPFDTGISVQLNSDNTFNVDISPHWSINQVPNGGYLMAILANAMMRVSDKKSSPIITANFMAKCHPGEAFVSVEKIASSKQFERFHAILFQDGEEKIRALGTFSKESIECVFDRYEDTPPEIAPPEECFQLPVLPDFTLLERVDMRLDPCCAGWMTGTLVEKSEHKGWIRFREDRPYDILSILLMADAFPPPVFASQGMVAWVPTIELSVNIRNMPQSKWLKCIFRTRFITCGLLEEDGQVWDETGSLVAVSRQIAQYRNNS